ncbi:GAF domain-containing protein [Actinorhabdospora filicis]|uniref:GAF domain-containing protein n=1 Tax=Actinorhabdospora filicis TaxID=1785913 RepID=A0A9W6W771_9ACTN|nr:ANTAR domain-containing protein [Actinorhabdospora filicis]GLZ75201.1 GAF domain-containing protein [Actinorhabdospora filicis]
MSLDPSGEGIAAEGVWARIAHLAEGRPFTMALVCRAALGAVGVDGAAVTVAAGTDARDVLHASDTVAAELEEWQITYGEGPGVDALEGGGSTLVADLGEHHCALRWPVFTPAALGSGAKALFALPLQVGVIRLGVLDLYRAEAGGLGARLAEALDYADAATALLLDGVDATHPDSDPHQAHVHQATGMVVVQLGVGAAAAYAALRAHAFAHGRHLGEVAADVVARRLRFDGDQGHDGR